MRTGNGRRTYLIDRGFQLKYTLMLVTLGAFASALFGTMMYLAHVEAQHGVEQALAVVGPALAAEAQSELAEANTTLVWLLLGGTALLAAALGLVGLLVTHRVAGPVLVMSRYINAVAAGTYPKMRALRKGDELQPFFDGLRGAIDRLREREEQEASALEQALGRLTPLANTTDAKAAIDALKAMHERKRLAVTPKAA